MIVTSAMKLYRSEPINWTLIQHSSALDASAIILYDVHEEYFAGIIVANAWRIPQEFENSRVNGLYLNNLWLRLLFNRWFNKLLLINLDNLLLYFLIRLFNFFSILSYRLYLLNDVSVTMVDCAHNSLVRVHLYLLHLIDYFLSDPANMRDHPVCLLPLQPLHPEQDPLL